MNVIYRKKHAGVPGNGGQATFKPHDGDAVALTDYFSFLPEGTCLVGEYGSRAHGTSDANSDRDFHALWIEPREFVTGLLDPEDEVKRHSTAGQGDKSGADDLDTTVYGLRKWAALAATGNPNTSILLNLSRFEMLDDLGQHLIDNKHLFWSKQLAPRFVGYLKSQRSALFASIGVKTPIDPPTAAEEAALGIEIDGWGDRLRSDADKFVADIPDLLATLRKRAERVHTRGVRVQRPDLVEKFGYDTKFAYHMVKMGIQGLELVRTGSLTIPFAEHDRVLLRGIRDGMHTLDGVVDIADALVADIQSALKTTDAPDKADYRAISRLLDEVYEESWARR